MEFVMLSDNLYCKKANSGPIFFVNVSANTVQGNAQINVNYVPASSEATDLGYSIPNSAWTFPTTKVTPQLTLSTGLQSIFGFQGGQSIFPLTPVIENQQYTSTNLAILSPSYCIILTCNLLDSSYSNVPTLLSQIPLGGVSFGASVKYEASSNSSIPISKSKFGSIKIGLFNQDLNPLQFKDWECSITLAIEEDTDLNLADAINNLVSKLS
jgi:hypothetical protein